MYTLEKSTCSYSSLLMLIYNMFLHFSLFTQPHTQTLNVDNVMMKKWLGIVLYISMEKHSNFNFWSPKLLFQKWIYFDHFEVWVLPGQLYTSWPGPLDTLAWWLPNLTLSWWVVGTGKHIENISKYVWTE